MEQNWNPFDADLLGQATEQAQQTSSTSNFGALSVQSRYLHFGGKGEAPEEVTAKEYASALKQKLPGYSQEIQFTCDPSEFNPNAPFIYSRKVRVVGREKIKSTGKWTKSDWIATVLPSINAVWGTVEEFAKALSGKKAVYVEVSGVPQQADPDYETIKFERTFANVQECAAAWKAKYGGNGNGKAKMPADVANTVRLLKKAIKDQAALTAAIQADPILKEYELETLLAIE